MNKHANLIYQLKQHARIGMADPNKYKDELKGKNTTEVKDGLNAITKAANEATEEIDALDAATLTVVNSMKKFREAMPGAAILMTEIGKVVGLATEEHMGFSRGLSLIIAQQRKYTDVIKTQVKANTFLEQQNLGLAESFNLNKVAAGDFMHVLRGKNLGIGDAKLVAYAGSLDGLAHGFINASTAANDLSNPVNKYVNNMMEGQEIMQNRLGLSEQEAQSFESFSAGIDKSSTDNLFKIQDIAKQMTSAGGNFEGVDPLQMQKDIIADIAELAPDIQMQYSRMPLGLMKATQYAKKLGMSMTQLHNTGKAFLNIEQSIGQELEYQLLSGQRLLTEQGTSLTNEYRMATIKGDGLKQAQLMSRFLEDQGDTLENNMFAREKAAQLFGIDEAQLSKSIQKQKLLNSLGATNLVEMANGDMETVYKQLAKAGADPDDILKLKEASDIRSTDKIANDYLAQIETNTTRDLTNEKKGTGSAGELVGKSSDAALKLATSYDKLITMFDNASMATILGQVQNIPGSLLPISTALDAVSDGIPVLEDLVKSLTKIITDVNDASILGAPAPVAPLTGVATTTPIIDKEDALIMNDGIVKFNKADKFTKVSDSTMIAGTNVDGNKKLARAITTGGGASIDYNQMAAAIVSAMKSATFVATVKPDLLFNGKKY